MGKFKDIWDRSKDGKRRDQRSFVRFAILLTALTVLFLCLRKDNVFRWIYAGFTLRKQQRQIEAVEADNARLDKQIHMLSTDRDTLEKFARESFLFASPGDDVFVEE